MRPLSLPKSCLITKSWQYNKVYKHGKRVRGNGFSLVFIASQREENRLGISISGVRSAVRRNRLKRLIRDFYRHNRSFPSLVSSQAGTDQIVDMVIAARKQFSPKNIHELSEKLLPLYSKACKGKPHLHPNTCPGSQDLGGLQ